MDDDGVLALNDLGIANRRLEVRVCSAAGAYIRHVHMHTVLSLPSGSGAGASRNRLVLAISVYS